jgi:phosphatidylinositol glycan class P protein
MALTTVAFVLWLCAVFADEDTLESFGAPSGALTKHYAMVVPMVIFATCVYAFLGYECLNLMSTPIDFDARFAALVPKPEEYILDGGKFAEETYELYQTDSSVPVFRELSMIEASRRMFGVNKEGDAKDSSAKAKTKAKTNAKAKANAAKAAPTKTPSASRSKSRRR